jgi:hypothetical protein
MLYYVRQQPDGTWPEATILAQSGVIDDIGVLQREKLILAIDEAGQPHFVLVGEDGWLYYGHLR